MNAGARLGPYEVVAPLGAGGMGEVYRARDTRLGRDVAVKVLPAAFVADPERLHRFELEARATAALNHPNILGIHDIGTHDGQPYIVGELLEGATLRELLRGGALPPGRAAEYGVQIATGLAAAHGRGIVHRDLKPENVFATTDGVVKILDFGLAKLTLAALSEDEPTCAAATPAHTEAGAVLGTVGYMAPEQVRGEAVDHRADIFAFGCLLHEMLTGRRAFSRPTGAGTLAAILVEDAPAPSSLVPGISRELDRLVGRCLAKAAGERFQSASDLAYALRSLVDQAAPARPGAPGRLDERPSVAVLPFANLCADAEQEYFCDGMAEEIINALAHVRGLRVVARTSSFAFKGRSQDIRVIGAALDVSALLEGSVRRMGDRLRITVQLIQVADGCHLWSERYDRRLEDVFAVQEEIALAIVANLKVHLLGEERAALGRRATDNLDAYSAYLRGLHAWSRLSPEGFVSSRECFEAAIRIDAGYVAAYEGLAMWYIGQAFWADLAPLEAWSRCRPAIERALELDPGSAMAQVGLGNVLGYFEHRWQAAEDSMRRGVQLGPNLAMAHMNLAVLLHALDRSDEATDEARLALRLDPLSVPNRVWSASSLDKAGHHEEARAEIERVIATEPSHWLPHWELCHQLARRGSLEAARAEAEQAVALSGRSSPTVTLLACVCHALGDGSRGEELRAELERRAGTSHVPPGFFAWIDAARGDAEGAVLWLERAAGCRDPWFAMYRTLPRCLLVSDSRIETVLARFGL